MEREKGPLGFAYDPYFIIDIDERSFLECFVNSGDKLLMLSWEMYDHTYQSALLKMESSPHAVAGGAFSTIFSAWARRVADPILTPTSTRTVRGQTRTKKADLSWAPRDIPQGGSHKWPTFAGEVAWSEPRTKLQADIEFWLDDPESCVNVAITITVLRGRIKIESWERNQNQPPSPTQWIEITRNSHGACPKVSGQLEIKFSDVFLRAKGPGEIDFILSEADMNEIAIQIWTFQYPPP